MTGITCQTAYRAAMDNVHTTSDWMWALAGAMTDRSGAARTRRGGRAAS